MSPVFWTNGAARQPRQQHLRVWNLLATDLIFLIRLVCSSYRMIHNQKFDSEKLQWDKLSVFLCSRSLCSMLSSGYLNFFFVKLCRARWTEIVILLHKIKTEKSEKNISTYFLNSNILIHYLRLGTKKRTGQFLRALLVYSIDNFVAFWLKWL